MMLYTIRPIDPTDAPALVEFYARLSPEARQRRFLGGCRGIDAAQARAFASENGFVATLREPGPNDGMLIGHGCMPRIDGRRAEAAFAVLDAYQGAGIGRALLAAVVGRSRELGLTHLVASMFAGNGAIHRLLLAAGPYRYLSRDGGVDVVEIAIGDGTSVPQTGMPKGMWRDGQTPVERGQTADLRRRVPTVR